MKVILSVHYWYYIAPDTSTKEYPFKTVDIKPHGFLFDVINGWSLGFPPWQSRIPEVILPHWDCLLLPIKVFLPFLGLEFSSLPRCRYILYRIKELYREQGRHKMCLFNGILMKKTFTAHQAVTITQIWRPITQRRCTSAVGSHDFAHCSLLLWNGPADESFFSWSVYWLL